MDALDEARRAIDAGASTFAEVLRRTVRDLLPHYDVYITDWVDARSVPAIEGCFDLDDYVDVHVAVGIAGHDHDLRHDHDRRLG